MNSSIDNEKYFVKIVNFFFFFFNNSYILNFWFLNKLFLITIFQKFVFIIKTIINFFKNKYNLLR